MKRFILLNYEPYLSIISEEKFLKPFLGAILDANNKIVSNDFTYPLKEFSKELKKFIKEEYKYENEDYIESIILTRINLTNSFSAKDYINLFHTSLEFLTENLFKGISIRDLEVFSYIKQYIEPNILLIYQLLKEGYRLPQQENLLNLFVSNKKSYIELHVHGETSYNFPQLINYIIKNWQISVKEILKTLLSSKDKNRSRYIKQFRNLLSIVASFLYFSHILEGNRVFYVHKHRENNFIPLLLKNYSSFLRRFSYFNFLTTLINTLLNSKSSDFDKLMIISTLLKINSLNQDIAFIGTYKGLKYMGYYFSGFLKKTYQIIRYKLRNDEDECIKSVTQQFNENSYLELRLSFNPKQVDYWIGQLGSKKNIKLILHLKKFKLEDFTSGINNFEKKLYKTLWYDKREKEGVYPVIRKIDTYKDYITGIDAASIEYWTPPWIYRIIFKFLKNYFKVYANKDIGITFHAGEDFIDVATGLRYIYESIYFLNTQRVGHGLALGVLLDRYHLKYPLITLHPIMYFFHLLWLNHLILKYPSHFPEYSVTVKESISHFFTQFLKEKAEKIIQKISSLVGNDLFLGLNELYDNLGFIHKLYSEASSFRDRNKIYKLLYATYTEIFADISKTKEIYLKIFKPIMNYLKNSYIKSKNSTKQITIYPLLPQEFLSFEKQLDFLRKIQQLVIERVKDQNVTIEVCPSSNIILYNIVSFKDHPILSNSKLIKNLKVTINTDNPLLLNTNIAFEYALVEQLFGKDKLEEFIETAHRSSF